MLLQTNSYIVPREKREEHARLVRKFRQVLLRLGCESFEIYEQVGTNWAPGEATGRYVQIMRFHDRKHQQAVQAAEKTDKGAQHVIREFCELINFPYQQQHGLFASGFYQSVLPVGASRHGIPDAPRSRPPVASRAMPPGIASAAAAAVGAAAPGEAAGPVEADLPEAAADEDDTRPGPEPDDGLEDLLRASGGHGAAAPAGPGDDAEEASTDAGVDEAFSEEELEVQASAPADDEPDLSAFDVIDADAEEGEVVEGEETTDPSEDDDRPVR